MGEQMMFPDTIEEFINEYKFTDTQEIYTNGSELIQVYRIKQWVDYHNDEIKKLNNIIDELEKTFIDDNKRIKEYNIEHPERPLDNYSKYYLDKLKELKEGK